MGKCKFRNDWLEKIDSSKTKVSAWGKKLNERELFCNVCTCTINFETKGFQAIFNHSLSAKHKANFESKCGIKQLHLKLTPPPTCLDNSQPSTSNCASTLCIYSVKDSSTIAELIWTMKSILSNYSMDSAHDICDVFKKMFPAIAPDHFSLSPKKMRYLITDGLAPYFQESMLEEACSSYYTLSYDETTNIKDKKELQTTITFWSESKCGIMTRHLKTFFLGKADSETLHLKLCEALSEANLSQNKCLTLGSDGPNVNKKVFRLFDNNVLETRGTKLINIGTCSIHTLHNAYVKGLECLGLEASEFLISIFHYFDGWPARWEEFEEIQAKCNVPHHKFIKHATTRWLTLGPAASRILEQWNSIHYYFFKHVPLKKNTAVLQARSYKAIVSALKKPSMKAELHFIISSAELISKFTQRFQSQAPMIHMLHREIENILQTFMARVLKTSVIKEISSVSEVDLEELFTFSKLLPLKELVFNQEVTDELSKLEEKDKMFFLLEAQKHYISICKYVMEKTCISSGSLKCFRFLDRKERTKDRSCKDILKVAKMMPFDVQQDYLIDEWKVLQLEKDDVSLKNKTIDEYWHQHISKKELSSKDLKFPNVAKVIKASLTLSHGNADIERKFSISKQILGDNKSAITERFLNSLLIVRDALKQYPHFLLVPISPELIKYARQAYSKYNAYMEECKKKKESELEDKQKEEQKRKDYEDNLKNMVKVNKSIESETEVLNKVKKEHLQTKEAREELLSEASAKLKKALESSDLKKAKLAYGMLEGVQSMQVDEKEKEKEVESIQVKLEKRKSSMITSFLSKMPKKK